MARASETLRDAELPGLEDLKQDPPPAKRGRPRKSTSSTRPPAKAAGNRGRVPARTPAGRIMSKAQIQAKVGEEVYMYLALATGAWEVVDPDCAGELYQPDRTGTERLAVVADRLTRMICRNDKLAEMVANSGLLGEAIALMSALVPVARAWWAHHGPNGDGHRDGEAINGDDYTARYPAYAGPANAA